MHGLSHGACATYQQIVCAIHVPDGISCSGTAATHVCLKRSGLHSHLPPLTRIYCAVR